MNLPATYNPPAQPPAINKPVNYTAGINPLSTEGRQLIETLAKSSIIPNNFRGKPDAILVVWLLGARVGLDVFASMQFIADINGKPTIYGDGALAVAYQNPRLKSLVEEYREDPKLGTTARCTIHVKTQDEPFVEEFSLADAKAANLLNKAGPWTQYPRRMLRMRARGYALRAAFPDSLAGFYLAEEMIGSQVVEADLLSIDGEPVKASIKSKVDAKVAEADARQATPAAGSPVILPAIGEDQPVVEPAAPTAEAPGAFDADEPAAPPAPTVTREQLVTRARAMHDAGIIKGPELAERYKSKKVALIPEEDLKRAWNHLDDVEDRPHTFEGAGT